MKLDKTPDLTRQVALVAIRPDRPEEEFSGQKSGAKTPRWPPHRLICSGTLEPEQGFWLLSQAIPGSIVM